MAVIVSVSIRWDATADFRLRDLWEIARQLGMDPPESPAAFIEWLREDHERVRELADLSIADADEVDWDWEVRGEWDPDELDESGEPLGFPAPPHPNQLRLF